MKNNKVKEMGNEDLLKAEKSLRIITYILAGMLVLLFLLNIASIFKKGFSAINVVPVALLPMLVVNLSNIKKMKEELKSRGLI